MEKKKVIKTTDNSFSKLSETLKTFVITEDVSKHFIECYDNNDIANITKTFEKYNKAFVNKQIEYDNKNKSYDNNYMNLNGLLHPYDNFIEKVKNEVEKKSASK